MQIKTPPPTNAKQPIQPTQPSWFDGEDEEQVTEQKLLEDLDDLIEGEDDDDDDEDDLNDPNSGNSQMSKLRKEKLARKKKQETLKRQHAGKNYDDATVYKRPLYRFIRLGVPIPIDPQTNQYIIMKGVSLFRAVVWHIVSFVVGPMLAVRKAKLEKKETEKKQLDASLNFSFEQTRSWLNKECKLAINSVLTDMELDLDVSENAKAGGENARNGLLLFLSLLRLVY